MKKIAFIILAGGIGKRFKNKIPKQFVKIGKYNCIELILNEIKYNKNINYIVIVYNKKHIKFIRNINKYKKLKLYFVKSGKTRQESSLNALKKLKKIKPNYVLIHDGCRPYVENKTINKIISLLNKNDGCAPLIKNVDLLRIKNKNKMIELNSDIYSSQTPQGFKYNKILKANNNYPFNKSKDDIELMNNNNIYKLKFINGNKNNIKITYKEDLKFFNFLKYKKIKFGIGFDIHPFNFNSNKKLKLLGVPISYYPLKGYSDADVGYHALCDSIFGALGIGDIGIIFKNTNPKWKNANSKIFVKFAKKQIDMFNATIINIDINFICEKPKIKVFSDKMKSNISKILNINKSQINIKATTNEKIGFIGQGKGIAAESIISISL